MQFKSPKSDSRERQVNPVIYTAFYFSKFNIGSVKSSALVVGFFFPLVPLAPPPPQKKKKKKKNRTRTSPSSYPYSSPFVAKKISQTSNTRYVFNSKIKFYYFFLSFPTSPTVTSTLKSAGTSLCAMHHCSHWSVVEKLRPGKRLLSWSY